MPFPTRLPAIFVLAALLPATPVLASSSEWVEAEGGRIRLVTTGLPEENGGKIRGALQIELKPGWKTYWRDPGDAGVPPSLTLRSGGTAMLDFPPPERFVDGPEHWAGYKHSVALPVTIGEPAEKLEAEVFLGICEQICIPVQASLTVDVPSDPYDDGDAALVAEAFAALPGPEREGFRATRWDETNELIVEAEVPADASDPVLFLAGDAGYSFDVPEIVTRDGSKVVFRAEVLAAPAALRPVTFPYTLVAGGQAVAGTLARR